MPRSRSRSPPRAGRRRSRSRSRDCRAGGGRDTDRDTYRDTHGDFGREVTRDRDSRDGRDEWGRDRGWEDTGARAERPRARAAPAPPVPSLPPPRVAAKAAAPLAPAVDWAEGTEDETALMAAFGLPTGFDTTQGKEAKDARTTVSGVHVKTKRSARQYMNRRGGFNRELPAEVTGKKVPLERMSATFKFTK